MITVKKTDSGYEILIHVGAVNIAPEDTNDLQITDEETKIQYEYIDGAYKIPSINGSRLKVVADTKQFGRIATEFVNLQNPGDITAAEISSAYVEGVNALE